LDGEMLSPSVQVHADYVCAAVLRSLLRVGNLLLFSANELFFAAVSKRWRGFDRRSVKLAV
jgi:hypothetical protein